MTKNKVIGFKNLFKTLTIALLLFILLASNNLQLTTNATPVRKEYIEKWSDVKFSLIIETNDVWNLPEDYKVNVTIKIMDMGESQYLWINRIKVGISLYVEEELLVDKKLTHVGDSYTTTITLKSNSAFKYLKPGESSSYSLSVDIKGEVKDKYSITWPGWTYEYFNINVKAPPAPIRVSYSLPEGTIRIGDRFSINVLVKNEGNYPIFNVTVELYEPLGASIVGDKEKSINTLNPKETATFTFDLIANYAGNTSATAYVSYKTITGYETSGFENSISIPFSISKKVSTITCTVSPEKVTKGKKITISGKLTPAGKEFITLTFNRPDGKTTEVTVTSTVDGDFTYEFEPDAEGSWSVKATWSGNLEYEPAKSPTVTFTVEKSGCFIATATYGSELSPEVQFLRHFRDDVVLSTFAGSNFMKIFNAWYYSFSPTVADFISNNNIVRLVMKIFLYPLIAILHLSSITYNIFSFNGELGIIIAGAVASALIGLVYFTPLALAFLKVLEKYKKTSFRVSQAKPLFVLWLVCIALVTLAELISLPTLMAYATGISALLTAILVSVVTALKINSF